MSTSRGKIKFNCFNLLSYWFDADDEPDDEGSPQHYILIHGVLTAPVLHHLSEIGVSVDALICVRAQNYESLTPVLEQHDESKDVESEAAKVRKLLIFLAGSANRLDGANHESKNAVG